MTPFRQLFFLLVLTLTSNGWMAQGFAEDAPSTSTKPDALRLGLLPHLSPQLLMKTYQPLANYLEQQLGRPVMTVSAPDFQTYSKRCIDGDYDIYLTAPHLAAFAEEQNRAHRLSRFSRVLHGVIVVPVDSPYTNVRDLRGLQLATPDPMAVITLLGEATLLEHGLKPHIDLDVIHMQTHNTALLAVANGRVDAAVAGVSAYEKMQPNIQSKLRVLKNTASVPHMMFMASTDLPDDEYHTIKDTLLKFTADGAGAGFFTTQGKAFADLVSISENDMQSVATLVPLINHGK